MKNVLCFCLMAGALPTLAFQGDKAADTTQLFQV